MTVAELQAFVYTILGTSSTGNSRLTPALLLTLLNDDYVAFAEETQCFTRQVLVVPAAPVYATASIYVGNFLGTGTVVAGDTVTIQGVVYTFRATTVPAAYDVLIGASKAESATNLGAAINGNGAAGAYGSGTVKHPAVTAEVSTETVTLTSVYAGTIGNGITLATNGGSHSPASITVSAALLSGGTDTTVAYPVDFTHLRSLTCDTVPLESTTTGYLDELNYAWRTQEGTPTHYYLDGDGIGFYPVSDGSHALLLTGVVAPIDQTEVANGYPLLVSTGSAPPLFPSRYHKALAYGTVTRLVTSPLFDIEGGPELAQYCSAMRADLVTRYLDSVTFQGKDGI